MGVAVHRGGGAENQPIHIMLSHHLAQRNGAADVVLIIRQGDGAGLPHRLQPGKVHHGIKGMGFKQLAQGEVVPYIAFDQRNFLTGNLPYPFDRLGGAVAEIIKNNHFMACRQQLNAGMGADIARSTGYQYLHDSIHTSNNKQQRYPKSQPVDHKRHQAHAVNRPEKQMNTKQRTDAG